MTGQLEGNTPPNLSNTGEFTFIFIDSLGRAIKMDRKTVTFQHGSFRDNVAENLRTIGTSSTGLGTMVSLDKAPSQDRLVQLAIMESAENVMKRGNSVLRQESTLISRRRLEQVDEEEVDDPQTLWCCFKQKSKQEEQIIDEVDKKKLSMSFNRRAIEKINKGRRSSVMQRLRGPAALIEGAGIEISDFSRMQRLVMEMKESIFQLENSKPPDEKVEAWACLIYESMSAASRTFHGVQHVFDVSVNCDEIQKLCAFFHDCIYYTIDGGLSKLQNEYLDGIIIEKDETVFLTKFFLEEALEMIICIFGFTKGQTLNPFKGLNEFLSAALAIRCFAPYLSKRYLAEIVTCIEATIPFRGGKPMDALYKRLTKANETFDLQMSEDEVERAVQRAADFANRDLLNFTLANRAIFLSNTWNLLPESNISLRNTRVFRISDFTHALLNMTGFFNSLDANTLFHNFRNDPSDKIVAELTDKARKNIKIASIYMNCKLLAISVLAAFAELSGGK